MAKLTNMPQVKLGVVGVSRDCFPVELTRRRLAALMKALAARGLRAHRCGVIIQSEKDAQAALADLDAKGCNAAVIYLGNFGPEGPTSLFAEEFSGPERARRPVMVCAAAEENKAALASDRGDALCGLLSCSYNLALRNVRAHMPERPVGLPDELAAAVAHFERVARIALGVRNMKILAFGPRPHDFLACHAPLEPFFRLGVEVMENSELDLLRLYQAAAEKKRDIARVVADMKRELGPGASYPDLLPKLAQFEVALLAAASEHSWENRYTVFANKCWPSFEFAFGFVPCYVNGRLADRGLPVACEVDMYGALSEYMIQLASAATATLLDINNTVPDDVLPPKADLKGAEPRDLFMGFHCGNTAASCMKNCRLNYQVIMNRLMEAGGTPDITRGTLEGQLRPGPTTLFRLQADPHGKLLSYVAEGEILDIDPCSFGSVGIVAIPGFARFYRHVLVGRHFPHHVAAGFARAGRTLVDALHLLGVDDVSAPLPAGAPYPGENPFKP